MRSYRNSVQAARDSLTPRLNPSRTMDPSRHIPQAQNTASRPRTYRRTDSYTPSYHRYSTSYPERSLERKVSYSAHKRSVMALLWTGKARAGRHHRLKLPQGPGCLTPAHTPRATTERALRSAREEGPGSCFETVRHFPESAAHPRRWVIQLSESCACDTRSDAPGVPLTVRSVPHENGPCRGSGF